MPPSRMTNFLPRDTLTSRTRAQIDTGLGNQVPSRLNHQSSSGKVGIGSNFVFEVQRVPRLSFAISKGRSLRKVGNAESSTEVEAVKGPAETSDNPFRNLNTLAVLSEQHIDIENLSAGEKMNATEVD